MAVLTVKNLTKRFGPPVGGFTAVDNISFDLQEGEILGLLGPNGAGKTTTIQMLLDVLTPTSGDITYFGKNLKTHRVEILEKVNFSSTYTNLPWNLTVQENLNYISYLYDIADRKKRLDSLVIHFRLKELLELPMTALSAGQLTRVNLAKAFVNYPRVLLLDEPTASLDPEIARFVRKFILSQREHYHISIIFTSHNMAEVEEICDRILFINNGKIIADDTPKNLAATIETCKINLVMVNVKQKELETYCLNHDMKLYSDNKLYAIELKERQIPDLLTFLVNSKISFSEITIDKPDLEDYFLLVASQNQHKEL